MANNMLFAVLNQALHLHLKGIASVEDIDKAWMAVRMANSGPFGIIDKIGLDVTLDILPDTPEKEKFDKFLTDMINRGNLGVKSGKGFYTYPDPAFEAEGFVVRAKPVEILK